MCRSGVALSAAAIPRAGRGVPVGHARKVHMVIRGGGLGASMSRYLIERIEAASNMNWYSTPR